MENEEINVPSTPTEESVEQPKVEETKVETPKVETKPLNEFDSLDVDDEDTPTQDFSDVPQQQGQGQEGLMSTGNSGMVYDWSNAPEGVKAPPRIDLNGQVMVLKKADMILPSVSNPWEKTKAGDKEFKYCQFVLFYDKESQQEYYSGVRTFNRDGKYSHPTITRDRNNQASKLLGLYADFKNKDINEVSLREFMGFLNSQPKVEIQTAEVTNPTTGAIVRKNMVGRFVN